MTTANFKKALQTFCGRVPFRHFIVELVSGDRFVVTHPEALLLRGRVIVFASPKKRFRRFDAASVCQLFDPLED